MTQTQPGSEVNLRESLKGEIVELKREMHSGLDHLGVPRELDGKNLSVGERIHLVSEERSRFRKEIGALVEECKTYRSRAEAAFEVAKAHDAPKILLDSIQNVIDTPKAVPLRKKRRWRKG